MLRFLSRITIKIKLNNKYLIRQCSLQYGWLLLLSPLYFGSPFGLVKILQDSYQYPAMLHTKLSNKIHIYWYQACRAKRASKPCLASYWFQAGRVKRASKQSMASCCYQGNRANGRQGSQVWLRIDTKKVELGGPASQVWLHNDTKHVEQRWPISQVSMHIDTKQVERWGR